MQKVHNACHTRCSPSVCRAGLFYMTSVWVKHQRTLINLLKEIKLSVQLLYGISLMCIFILTFAAYISFYWTTFLFCSYTCISYSEAWHICMHREFAIEILNHKTFWLTQNLVCSSYVTLAGKLFVALRKTSLLSGILLLVISILHISSGEVIMLTDLNSLTIIVTLLEMTYNG